MVTLFTPIEQNERNLINLSECTANKNMTRRIFYTEVCHFTFAYWFRFSCITVVDFSYHSCYIYDENFTARVASGK